MATDGPVANSNSGVRVEREPTGNWTTYLLLSALAATLLFPVYTTVVRAISDPVQLLSNGTGLTPIAPDWGIFGDVLAEDAFTSSIVVSFVTAAIVVVAQAVTSIFTAYALVFVDFPFKKTVFGLIAATLLLPIEVTLVANVETVRDLGWFNSYQGLAAPFLAWAFGIFLLRQAFLGIPAELRDAATLDGYGHLGFISRVALPVIRPMLGSFVLISFLSAWNQYLWPRFATDKSNWQTVQIALKTLSRQEIDKLNFGFAAAILSAVPLLVLLAVFQKQMIRGLTAGAVKG